MTIAFEAIEIPTKAAEKRVEDNPYWPMVQYAMSNNKATRFSVPVEDGDDWKKATGRVRTRLNEISDHLDRTIRCQFSETSGTGEVWVMDRKIKKARKSAATETATETPAETPAETVTETPVETTTETPVETATETATETETGRKGRRNRQA